MERLTILIPDEKVELVKALLKELGCIIEADLIQQAKDVNDLVLPGETPTMDEIVEEIRALRASR